MTPTQRATALRLLSRARLEGVSIATAQEAFALLGELAAPVNQSLTTEPDCYGYASRLATGIWEKHYKADSPQWKPLDDTLGVLTQIDNMASGLTRTAEPVQEPVAWLVTSSSGPVFAAAWKQGAHEHINDMLMRDEIDDLDEVKSWRVVPVYAAPQQRQPLSDEQIHDTAKRVYGMTDWTHIDEMFARAIEKAITGEQK